MAATRLADTSGHVPSRSEILTNFSASAVEGYLEYKMYQKIDAALFDRPSCGSIGQPRVESNSRDIFHTDNDEDED